MSVEVAKSLVEELDRKIRGHDPGEPFFTGDGYTPHPFRREYFRPIRPVESDRRVAFLDGGNVEVLGAPNFSIQLNPGPSGKPRGGEARTRRSRDGDWAKRRKGSSFGYKLHAKTDTDRGLVRDLEVTSASVHDSRVDLSREGEVVYRDKGYLGVKPRGYDATMRRGVRGHPLSFPLSPVVVGELCTLAD